MAVADDRWFDQQYNARAAVPEFAEIFARGEASSRRARLTMPCFLDAPYGERALETMDIFPSAGRSLGVVSFIHGGYWRSRDKSDFSFLARTFCGAGYTLAIPNYALCSNITIEYIVRQMLKAHAWLFQHATEYRADGARLIVCGHSAGAQLAAMMAACDWHRYEHGLPPDLVKGAIAVSGIYDLMPLRGTSINDDLRLDENAARVASPVTYSPSRAVPVVVAVGARESSEFQRQAKMLAECWPHCVRQSIVMPEDDHFTIVESLADRSKVLFEAINSIADSIP